MPANAIVGSQTPRLLHLPEGQHGFGSGEAALELARSTARLTPDEWQEFCILNGCSERIDGSWAAFETYLDVPRQNGKGDVLMIRQLAGLFVFKEKLQLHSAHEFKTAREHFLRVRAVIDGVPELSKRVKAVFTGSGNESIVLQNGCRLLFVARSRGSIRGFTGNVLYLDEAFKLSDEARGAMIPALSAVKNPQIWYASSAPHADSDTLHQLQSRMRSGESPNLFAASWSNEPDADPYDREAWARANPALGKRLSAEFTMNELESLPAAEFLRERLGVAEILDTSSAEISPGAWEACADHRSVPQDPVVFGVDVSPERGGSIVVAAASSTGGVHVELVEQRPGTDWIVARARELQDKWVGSKVGIVAGSPAWSLEPDLIAAGVQLVPMSTAELAQACGSLADGVRDQSVKHRGDTGFVAALRGAKSRLSGDAWLWSRKSSTVDISPIIAATVARWVHLQTPSGDGFAFVFGGS